MKWKFWQREKEKKVDPQAVADKYGIQRPPSLRSQLRAPLMRRDDDDDIDNPGCLFKSKYLLIGFTIGAAFGFGGGWAFFTKPWEQSTSHPDSVIPPPVIIPPSPTPGRNETNCTTNTPPPAPATFACPLLYPDRDFDELLQNGTATDTDIPAGYDGYTLQILSLQTSDNRAKVIAGIPALKNNHADLLERTAAYLHRPYLTTGVDYAYHTPPTTDHVCLYRIGQWLAPGDPAYVPLNPEKLDAPAIYTMDIDAAKPLTKDELLKKFHAKRAELREKSITSDNHSQSSHTLFSQNKGNPILEKFRNGHQQNNFTRKIR